jgi:hypothetical protein
VRGIGRSIPRSVMQQGTRRDGIEQVKGQYGRA